MQFPTATAAAIAGLSNAWNLSMVPNCAQSCIANAFNTVKCSTNDWQCMCQQKDAIFNAVNPCITSQCNINTNNCSQDFFCPTVDRFCQAAAPNFGNADFDCNSLWNTTWVENKSSWENCVTNTQISQQGGQSSSGSGNGNGNGNGNEEQGDDESEQGGSGSESSGSESGESDDDGDSEGAGTEAAAASLDASAVVTSSAASLRSVGSFALIGLAALVAF